MDPSLIAGVLHLGLDLVKLGQEIHARQNVRSQRKRKRKNGYAFVVQEIEFSKKFKVGSAQSNDDWITRLSAKIPGRLEAVLVVPTDDIRQLERELHEFCATNRNVGDWFDLTPAQVTQLRQLQVVVDLATGSIAGARAELDDDDLEQAKRMFELLTNASGAISLDQKTDETEDTAPDLDLKSVSTGNYRTLPKLKRRSGYLLVVRDVENGTHRIESTAYPFQYIGEALSLVNPRFGLELILASKSKRVYQVEKNLSILYPADDENGWRRLSTPQLQEIRNLAAPGPVQQSIYVTPKSHWGLETVQTNDYKELPRLRYPNGYVCITQGVKPGKKFKIWHTTKPKDLADDLRLALMLNNPHDATTSAEPIRFACVIKAESATAFKDFLHKRYSKLRQSGDWFDLDEAQLNEINDMANHR